MSENELSKKNADYIFRLKKAITADDSKIESVQVDEILSTTKNQLLEGQKKGQTAAQLFGTVNQYALDLKDPKGSAARRKKTQELAKGKPSAKQATTDFMKQPNLFDFSFRTLAIDTTLELMIMFFGMYGITGMLAAKNSGAQQMGITTLIVLSVLTGILYSWISRFLTPNPKSTEPLRPAWKTILITLIVIAGWLLIFFLAAFIPSILNPKVPAVVLLVVAAALLVFYLNWKKRTGIPKGFLPIGTLSTTARMQYRQLHPKGAKK